MSDFFDDGAGVLFRGVPFLGNCPRRLFGALGNVEVIFDDVAVLHDVFLALGTHLALLLGGGDGTELDERFPIDDVRADESLFEIGMNFSRGLGRFGALDDRPGARFLFARGEVRDEP